MKKNELLKHILLLIVWAGMFSCASSAPYIRRELPEFLKFTGGANQSADGLFVECLCDLNLELPDFKLDGDAQQYSGTLGGEIIRIVTDDGGAGFSFAPFLFGEVTLTLLPNDSVYLHWPGNEGTGIPFYDEITVFKGKLNRDEASVTGSWKCAPLNLDSEGYVDTSGIAQGTWQLEEFE